MTTNNTLTVYINDQPVLIDAGDAGLLADVRWYVTRQRNTSYVARHIMNAEGKRSIERLHRVVMKPAKGVFVDHINGNGLDNRKANLRCCTNGENLRNQRKPKSGGHSKFKGVSRNKGRWIAYITTDRRRFHLGVFSTETAAAGAYDAAAREHFGEFARLNLPSKVALQ